MAGIVGDQYGAIYACRTCISADFAGKKTISPPGGVGVLLVATMEELLFQMFNFARVIAYLPSQQIAFEAR